ncbi:MAG: hypothetical protein HY860_02115 [Chlamydiales bacterium]|nr:hypothetical protein [Chlamydiales bacterium]
MKNLTSLFKRVVSSSKIQPDNLKKALGNEVACYVLITCTTPDKKGKMNVDLVYEGDRELAAYLIRSAQGALD